MDVAKLISRKHLALQCLLQAKKGIQSVAVSTLSREPASRVVAYPRRLSTCVLSQSRQKGWDNRHLIGGRISAIKWYSSEASSPSDKQETSSSTDETAAKEEDEVESEETPTSEGLSVNKSESEKLVRSEQGESEVENSKLDKLYKVIELEVLAYEPSVLDSYQWFVVTAATHLGIQVGKSWSPQHSERLRFQLLKSAFVHKKHVVHYEVRTHHRFLTFHKLTSSTADTFLEYIERNLPEGVGLKVTRVEAKAVPDYLQKQAHQQQQ